MKEGIERFGERQVSEPEREWGGFKRRREKGVHKRGSVRRKGIFGSEKKIRERGKAKGNMAIKKGER